MKTKIILAIMLLGMFSVMLFGGDIERKANIYYLKADSLFLSKDYAGAIQNYNNALQKYKEAKEKENALVEDKVNEILLGKLWKAYYFNKQYDEAIQALKNNFKIKGAESKDIEKLIVTIYKKKKDYNGAIQFLLEREKIKPSLWREKKLGSLYYKKEDYKAAVTWYNKVKEKKLSSSIVKKIANCYMKLKDYKMAVQTYELYLKSLGDNASDRKLKSTYKNMATMYYNIDKREMAIKYWKKILDISFDKDTALNLLIVYYDKKKYDQALKMANLLLKKKPGMADAIFYKAKIYYDKGNKTMARKYFVKLKSNPTYGKTAKDFIKSIDSEG